MQDSSVPIWFVTCICDACRDLGLDIERVVTLDKLTYTGNLFSLADLKDEPRHIFMKGDIGDSALVAKLLRDHRICAVMHLAAESHVDRSIDNPEDFVMTNLDVVRALVATVRELAPGQAIKSADELISFVRDRPGHDRRYAIDPSRIERELGWSPRENFASGLRRTVQWYLDNEDWIRGIEDGSYRRAAGELV